MIERIKEENVWDFLKKRRQTRYGLRNGKRG